MDVKTKEINNNNDEHDDVDKLKLNAQFKDEIKALSELNMDEVYRGTTPEDIDRRCVEICKTYLGGSWLGATEPGDIVVKRINGGLTNQLYQVTLSDRVPTNCSESVFDETTEPREVSIKLYQAKHFDTIGNGGPERLSDTIISTMVSQANIGPKIYGIFSDGVLQGYYQHEQFQTKHQKNPELVRKLADILAQIHHMNVPLPKKRDQMATLIRTQLAEGLAQYDIVEYANRLSVDCFLEHDLGQESEFICKLMLNSDIPLVFCHNDFRGMNIMVTEGGNELVVCDYEYSSYGHRSWDLAQIMADWDRDMADTSMWKTVQTNSIESFVRQYIDACERIKPGYKQLPINSLERIVKEVKFATLAQKIFFTNFFLAMKQPIVKNFGSDNDQKFKMVGLFFQRYLNYKDILIKEGLLTNDGQLNL